MVCVACFDPWKPRMQFSALPLQTSPFSSHNLAQCKPYGKLDYDHLSFESLNFKRIDWFDGVGALLIVWEPKKKRGFSPLLHGIYSSTLQTAKLVLRIQSHSNPSGAWKKCRTDVVFHQGYLDFSALCWIKWFLFWTFQDSLAFLFSSVKVDQAKVRTWSWGVATQTEFSDWTKIDNGWRGWT